VGAFDLILAVGALHHASNVEYVVDQAHSALKPGGLLVANEYIGPDFWQVSPRQYELINAAIHLLPPDLRERKEDGYWPGWLWPLGKLESRLSGQRFNPLDPVHALRRLVSRKPLFGRLYDPPPRWYWSLRDPSEGVHASRVLPALRSRFERVEVRHYNASILYHALDETFYKRYDDQNPRHRRFLDLLMQIEREMVDLGEIPSIAAHIVAEKAS
jgi:SAM-dependent methyltransferase